MEIAFITPTAFLEDYSSQGDFYLVLSHLFEGNLDKINDYANFHRFSDKFKIMDNGLFENHKPEGIDALLAKSNIVNADMIVAPDKLYDTKGTQIALEHFLYVKKNMNNDRQVMAVVQADNPEDYINQFIDFCENPDVDRIGLSILSIPESFRKKTGTDKITENRIYLLKKLLELDMQIKDCHLLGLGDSLEDVMFAAKNCPFVVSHDSSSAFWNGIQGRVIQDNGKVERGKTPISVDFDWDSASVNQLVLAQSNIDKYKQLIKGDEDESNKSE